MRDCASSSNHSAPGYRCACEPAAVERSSVRTTPRRTAARLKLRTIRWRHATRLAAERTNGRLLPGLYLATFRAAVVWGRSATIRTDTADACATPEEPA
jgi:hypothetical protein